MKEVDDNDLTLSEYQIKARNTSVYPSACGLDYTILGLVGEAGEVANKYKKVLRDDDGVITTKRRDELIDELGDTLWYLAMIAHELNVGLNKIAQHNLSKLAQRKLNGTLPGSGDQR